MRAQAINGNRSVDEALMQLAVDVRRAVYRVLAPCENLGFFVEDFSYLLLTRCHAARSGRARFCTAALVACIKLPCDFLLSLGMSL